MDQIKRITYMEDNLNKVSQAVEELEAAFENYESIQKNWKELLAYYDSRQWRRDFEDDEAGKLPADLRRGVLSEDAVYNLLTENQRLLERIQNYIEEP